MKLEYWIKKASKPIGELCTKHISEYERGIGSHPSKQKERGGLRLHTVQVINKALELNQVFDSREIIETCLIHDLKHCLEFPMNDTQRTAILATKGLSWDVWRHTPHYKFVALILIADMWSAYINEKNE